MPSAGIGRMVGFQAVAWPRFKLIAVTALRWSNLTFGNLQSEMGSGAGF